MGFDLDIDVDVDLVDNFRLYRLGMDTNTIAPSSIDVQVHVEVQV